jgi:hypothetical protein
LQQVIHRASFPLALSGMGALAPIRFNGVGSLGVPTQTDTTIATLVGGGLAIATPVITTAAAAGAAASLAAGGSGLILGMTASLAVPVIGAALAVVTAIITTLIKNSGCGQTCIETSQWANQAEPALAQNIQAYFALPAPRTISQQNAALANFIAVWTTLVNQCSQAGLGTAGQDCIADRQAGACKWKQTADSVLLSIPGEPQVGECWNWWSGYHDPIAMDTVVSDDPTAAQQVISSQNLSSSLTSNGMLYLAAGAGLLLLFAMGDN